jgi:hypothetical protein
MYDGMFVAESSAASPPLAWTAGSAPSSSLLCTTKCPMPVLTGAVPEQAHDSKVQRTIQAAPKKRGLLARATLDSVIIGPNA